MSQKIKIASKNPTPKDLSFSHYTTMNFGHCIPVCSYEVTPKSKFKIKPSVFARVAPQKLPNLGSLSLNLNAFYIPFRYVWNAFDNFYTGRKHWLASGAQIYRNAPYTNAYYLSRLLCDSRFGSTSTVQPIQFPNMDLLYVGESYATGVQLNKKGKYVYHVLSALGYKFAFNPNTSSESADDKFSLLPLLAFFKVFLDMYIPSQLQPSSYINQILKAINETTATNMAQPIDETRIARAFEEIYTYYQRNYFTSAWQKPNAVVQGLISYDEVSINSISTQSAEPEIFDTVNNGQYAANSTEYGTFPDEEQNSSIRGVGNLSADGLTLIKKFNNFIKRLNYSGSRAIEALKSLFGISADEFELGMTRYLGSYNTELNKTDVTVTGSLEEAGEFAGKSWFSSQNDKTFACDCDYHGMIFVLSSLSTPSTFVRGVRRNLFHIKPNDFYNPDFDGTLLQAISGSEVFSQLNFTSHYTADERTTLNLQRENVFGFVPRYNEYNVQLDNVSGDFDLERYGISIQPFLLNREIYDIEKYRNDFLALTDQDHSQHMDHFLFRSLYDSSFNANVLSVLSQGDANQYNRIFKDMTGIIDPFFCVFHFDTLAITPTIPTDEVAEIVGRGKELRFEKDGKYLV